MAYGIMVGRPGLVGVDGVFAEAGACWAVWAQVLRVICVLAVGAVQEQEGPLLLVLLRVGSGHMEQLRHIWAVEGVSLGIHAGKGALWAIAREMAWFVASKIIKDSVNLFCAKEHYSVSCILLYFGDVTKRHAIRK